MAAELSSNNLLDMPDMVIIYIFSFLPIRSLASISTVSKQMKNHSEDNILWKPKCNEIRASDKTKLNYKNLYCKNISTDWIESFSSPSYAFCIQIVKPETICTAIINDKTNNKPIIYFGASKHTIYRNNDPFYGLYYYDSTSIPSKNNPRPKPILFDNESDWKYDSVNCMDIYNDKLLVCSTTSPKHDNILILDGQTQKLLFSLKHNFVFNIDRSYHKPVSMVKFADNGNMLYSSSPYEHGVILWDITKQKQLKIFNHRIKQYENVNSKKNECDINSVCPTKNGNYFVSGSYGKLYCWDKRMNIAIKIITFYENNEYENCVYPLNLTGFIENETRFLCIGQRPSKIRTFEFPSFEYKLNQQTDFILPVGRGSELNGLYVTQFNTVACNIYGGVFLWNNFEKGQCLRMKPKWKSWHGSGSGYNGCYVNSSFDTISLSMKNPGSAWAGGIGAVFSINDWK
eukprot:333134_1